MSSDQFTARPKSSPAQIFLAALAVLVIVVLVMAGLNSKSNEIDRACHDANAAYTALGDSTRAC